MIARKGFGMSLRWFDIMTFVSVWNFSQVLFQIFMVNHLPNVRTDIRININVWTIESRLPTHVGTSGALRQWQ